MSTNMKSVVILLWNTKCVFANSDRLSQGVHSRLFNIPSPESQDIKEGLRHIQNKKNFKSES